MTLVIIVLKLRTLILTMLVRLNFLKFNFLRWINLILLFFGNLCLFFDFELRKHLLKVSDEAFRFLEVKLLEVRGKLIYHIRCFIILSKQFWRKLVHNPNCIAYIGFEDGLKHSICYIHRYVSVWILIRENFYYASSDFMVNIACCWRFHFRCSCS